MAGGGEDEEEVEEEEEEEDKTNKPFPLAGGFGKCDRLGTVSLFGGKTHERCL